MLRWYGGRLVAIGLEQGIETLNLGADTVALHCAPNFEAPAALLLHSRAILAPCKRHGSCCGQPCLGGVPCRGFRCVPPSAPAPQGCSPSSSRLQIARFPLGALLQHDARRRRSLLLLPPLPPLPRASTQLSTLPVLPACAGCAAHRSPRSGAAAAAAAPAPGHVCRLLSGRGRGGARQQLSAQGRDGRDRRRGARRLHFRRKHAVAGQGGGMGGRLSRDGASSGSKESRAHRHAPCRSSPWLLPPLRAAAAQPRRGLGASRVHP